MDAKEWRNISNAICDITSCNDNICPMLFVSAENDRSCRMTCRATHVKRIKELDVDSLAEALKGCSTKYILHKIVRDKLLGTDFAGIIFSAMNDTITLE